MVAVRAVGLHPKVFFLVLLFNFPQSCLCKFHESSCELTPYTICYYYPRRSEHRFHLDFSRLLTTKFHKRGERSPPWAQPLIALISTVSLNNVAFSLLWSMKANNRFVYTGSNNFQIIEVSWIWLKVAIAVSLHCKQGNPNALLVKLFKLALVPLSSRILLRLEDTNSPCQVSV